MLCCQPCHSSDSSSSSNTVYLALADAKVGATLLHLVVQLLHKSAQLGLHQHLLQLIVLALELAEWVTAQAYDV